MIPSALTRPQPRPTVLRFIDGDESPSGLAELHFDDADGRPALLVLPIEAQHMLIDALLWERRHDTARPEVVDGTWSHP